MSVSKPKVIASGQIQTSRAPLYKEPNFQSMQVSQLLLGEQFDCLEFLTTNLDPHWHLVQSRRDKYRGYLYTPLINNIAYQATAKVIQLSTVIYSSPNMKASIICELPFGAELCIEEEKNSEEILFYHCEQLDGWIHKSHIQFNHTMHSDPVVLARKFIGLSYMWGGRSGWGCDCSSLVQLCFEVCGCLLPRDSHQQEHYLQENMEEEIKRSEIGTGDLIFWPGHVAIASSNTTIIHATCVGMHVIEEELVAVEKRIYKDSARQLSSIHRPKLLKI